MAHGAIQVVILCGGRGTRAHPHTEDLPKPLLEVAGRPILHHVMDIYQRQMPVEFVLAGGYKVDHIEDFAAALPPEYRVTVHDSGVEAGTAERLWMCRHLLEGRFFATYGDGLANVDLSCLLDRHDRHGDLATLTTVPLPSQYGTVDRRADGRVTRFSEKPVLRDHRINGGFFVFERRVFDHWHGHDLEKQVLPSLAASGHLNSYDHPGFWKSMDTYKDGLELTSLASDGHAPWFDDLPVTGGPLSAASSGSNLGAPT